MTDLVSETVLPTWLQVICTDEQLLLAFSALHTAELHGLKKYNWIAGANAKGRMLEAEASCPGNSMPVS